MAPTDVKIVYVLCTNNRDYLHLLPATATLTKTTLPACTTMCLVDRQTRDFAASIGFRIHDWVDEVAVVEAPHSSPMVNSRYLKTTMRPLVSGDFLYLDIDAIVVDERLLAILDAPCIAASQNIDRTNITARFPEEIAQSIYSPLGWDHPFLPYVNAGVLFCRDNDKCHTLFRRWHERWNEQRTQLGICFDQASLNRAIWEMPGCLTLLPPSCNSPVEDVPELEAGACVYHYYISALAGKARPDSLLGLVSKDIQRYGPLESSIVRRALMGKRAFLPAAMTLEDAGLEDAGKERGRARMRTDVTVILVAHAEGRLVHATVRSAVRALSHLREHGYTGELLAVLDRPNQETEKYFAQFENCFDCILRSDFGDPGLARNLGVSRGTGDFITILDGDDLLCENWLTSGLEFCRSQVGADIVAHPEYNVHFGRENHVFVHENYKKEAALTLIEHNLWTMLCFLSRELIHRVPYRPTSRLDGFGYEDWLMNCDLIECQASHCVVPGTAYFKRSKLHGSRLRDDAAAGVTMPASGFFELPMWTASTSEIEAYVKGLKKPLRAIPSFRYLFGLALSAVIQWVAKPAVKRLLEGRPMSYERARLVARAWNAVANRLLDNDRREPVTSDVHLELPGWLLDELTAIHELEPALFPSRHLRARVSYYRVPRSQIATPYRMMNTLYPPHTTHVLLIPWLKRGGADLVTTQYARALIQTGGSVTCISTEDSDSPWLSWLPEGAGLIQEGCLASRLSINERCRLLQRLLLQKKPQVIHIVNSKLGYEVVARYGQSLRTQSRIFASVFCSDFTAEGQRVGFPTRGLVQVFDHLSGVITDNRAIVDYLSRTFAFEGNHFFPLRQPVIPARHPVERSEDREMLGVLWAGRLVRQKRPDILIRVAAAAMSLPVHFHVYGEPQPDSREYITQLKRLKNVSYHGVFDGFFSLPTHNFDIFLYTSQWDGTPNVILEAMASGLACIAPNIGGIPESIDESNGCIVSEPGAISEYVDFLSKLCGDRRELRAKGIAAAAKIARDNSWPGFVEALTSIPGYGPRLTKAESSGGLGAEGDSGLSTGQ